MSKKPRPDLSDLGPQVSGWRRARGMTQAELESRAGLGHNAVSRIETGQVSPRLENLSRIAQALGLTTEELQFRKPPAMRAETPESGMESLIERLKTLDMARREAILATFHSLLDQMGVDR